MIHLRILKRVVSTLALFYVLTLWTPPATAITGGEPDGNGHPNVCAIMITPEGYPPHLLCSGVLISNNMVLTAGHATQILEGILGNLAARPSSRVLPDRRFGSDSGLHRRKRPARLRTEPQSSLLSFRGAVSVRLWPAS